jgi:hypothetical protein
MTYNTTRGARYFSFQKMVALQKVSLLNQPTRKKKTRKEKKKKRAAVGVVHSILRVSLNL